MEIKDIKSSFKKEKRGIKSAYKKTKRNNRAEYKYRMDELKTQHIEDVALNYTSRGKQAPQNPPKRHLLEEIGNAVSHGLGSLFAVVAIIFMATHAEDVYETVGAWVYFFGLFVMFTMSCLYHAFPHGSRVKRLFRRFDYSSIYLLIGATFAPILLSKTYL